MEIAVGSENPVKIAAVEAVLGADASVTAVDVDSGVAEQPRSVAETIEGADTRARRALDRRDAAYGVGIEGGVARLEAPGLWLVMWATVTDGDRLERGAGPSLRLPDALTERIEGGAELGPAIDDVFGTEDAARGQGAAGLLTDGAIDRETALTQAVACAVGPFRVDVYE